jgi:hypothetical protein
VKQNLLQRTAMAAFAISAVALTAGCATMSAEECMVADWYRLGDLDARAGRGSDFLANRAGDCAEAGYPADTEAWYAGFEHGLLAFCTLDSGFRFGLEGKSYERSCPAHLEAGFLDGFELGQSIHQLQSRVNASRQEVDRLTRELRRLERDDKPDRAAISEARDDRDRARDRLRAEEVELATLRGMAQGRGFRLPR